MIIYKTTNLINNKTYIGQHNGKISNYLGSGKLLKQAIKKYGKENFDKYILLEGEYNQEFIDYLEKHYIRLFNSTHKELGYNIQIGGRGYKDMSMSTNTRELQSKRMMGNTIMMGLKRSEESKEKQAKTWSYILMSRSKESRSQSALKSAETARLRHNMGVLISNGRQKNKKLDWDNKQTLPVIQETKQGTYIKIWASAYEVYKVLGYNASHIGSVCNNKPKFKTVKGFKWRFATEQEILNLRGRNKTKK